MLSAAVVIGALRVRIVSTHNNASSTTGGYIKMQYLYEIKLYNL